MPVTKSGNYVVVLSLDALNAKDFSFIKTLPNFKSFIEEGSYVREVQSVYPTLTYTCHTSIITGSYPNKHGIFANEKAKPSTSTNQEWYWYEKDIKVSTLFDYAKKASLKTASIFWPVMAGGPIDYNCPEIWSVDEKSDAKVFLKHVSKSLIPTILHYSYLLNGRKQPNLDNFIEKMTTSVIKRKKPNLICVHFTELDTARHLSGYHHNTNKCVLANLDTRIGNIIQATKEAGIYDQTTFVLLGDHGTYDFENIIYLNTLFAKDGLLSVDQNNQITSWAAYANGCGGSVQIIVNEKASENDKKQLNDTLGKLTVMPNSFVKNLYTKEDTAVKQHLEGDFSYVIEAKDGYIFKNGIMKDYIIPREEVKNTYMADHGYDPTHEYMKTIFLAKGPRIKKGVCIDKACIIDEGPTIAKLLDIEMKNVDGQILTEILV